MASRHVCFSRTLLRLAQGLILRVLLSFLCPIISSVILHRARQSLLHMSPSYPTSPPVGSSTDPSRCYTNFLTCALGRMTENSELHARLRSDMMDLQPLHQNGMKVGFQQSAIISVFVQSFLDQLEAEQEERNSLLASEHITEHHRYSVKARGSPSLEDIPTLGHHPHS